MSSLQRLHVVVLDPDADGERNPLGVHVLCSEGGDRNPLGGGGPWRNPVGVRVSCLAVGGRNPEGEGGPARNPLGVRVSCLAVSKVASRWALFNSDSGREFGSGLALKMQVLKKLLRRESLLASRRHKGPTFTNRVLLF